MINHRLRKASLKGSDVMMVNSVDYDFNYDISGKIIKSPSEIPMALAGIIKAFEEMGNTGGRIPVIFHIGSPAGLSPRFLRVGVGV